MQSVRLEWYVKSQHSMVIPWDEWVELADQLGFDPENLDEAYEVFDTADYRAEEELYELASDDNWVDYSGTEMIDLRSTDA